MANQIIINNSIECFISDNKMPELIQFLNEHGYDMRETENQDEVIDGS